VPAPPRRSPGLSLLSGQNTRPEFQVLWPKNYGPLGESADRIKAARRSQPALHPRRRRRRKLGLCSHQYAGAWRPLNVRNAEGFGAIERGADGISRSNAPQCSQVHNRSGRPQRCAFALRWSRVVRRRTVCCCWGNYGASWRRSVSASAPSRTSHENFAASRTSRKRIPDAGPAESTIDARRFNRTVENLRSSSFLPSAAYPKLCIWLKRFLRPPHRLLRSSPIGMFGSSPL
jgi:hypothetical protein